MCLKKWVLGVLLMGLSACGSRWNQRNPLPHDDRKLEEIPKDYTQTMNLNLIHTGEELKNVASNTISFTGSGAKSLYKAIYKFNSQENSSFKLIRTSLISSTAGCRVTPRVKMMFPQDGKSKELILMDQLKVIPNTDYVLDVSFDHSCKNLELTFNLIAWLGDQREAPRIAASCDSQKLGQTFFFWT